MPKPPDAPLAASLVAGDPAAIAAALNMIDDERPSARARALALSETLAADGAGRAALRVGITGPPGAGKSSLLDVLVRTLRRTERRVGIIAVDPSSQRSGGALLGDRVRVRSSAGDDGVFFRSMAARDRLGGVSDVSYPSVEVLAAAFDVVFIETVGIGQSEAEVAALVDTLVFVLQPGAGDMLQFMKAGVLELPDIFAVNKADLGTPAQRTASELQAGLSLGTIIADDEGAHWKPQTLLVSAQDGTGIDDLVAAIDAHRAHLDATGALDDRRRAGRQRFVADALERRFGRYGVERFGGDDALAARIAAEADASVLALLEHVGADIEAALAKAD